MALLNTDFLTARTQSFRATRHMLTSALQEGVVSAGDYKVTPTGTSLQWSVAAGAAWVQGDDTTRQGLYHQVNDGAVTGLVAAGHATNPRIDQVILRIFDSSVTGVSDTPTLSTLAGTATAGATLENRTGAAALPNGALRLADVLVPAAHSGVLIANTHIRDRRPWARGGYKRIVRASADYTGMTSTSFQAVDNTNLRLRMECSGVPLRISARARVSNATAGANTFVTFFVDDVLSDTGSGSQQFIYKSVGAGDSGIMVPAWDFVPSAGSHQFSLAWAVGSGSATMTASAAHALQFVVEELVRQNADNS